MKTAARGAGRPRAASFRTGPVAALLLLLLPACAVAPPRGEVGIDGIACAIADAPVPAALQARPELAVPRAAVGASGHGGICRGRVYEVREPVQIHRLWEARRRDEIGTWWTFRVPTGSRAAYRADYAVCRAWNALDHAVTCTLKPGTLVVIGPGQSAVCGEKTYPKSPVNQVYVPADARDGSIPAEECSVRGFP